MCIVFCDPFFGGFKVHRPTAFPFVSFAWETVKNVVGVTVLKALDLVTLKLNGIKDFRSGTSVVDFAHLHLRSLNNAVSLPSVNTLTRDLSFNFVPAFAEEAIITGFSDRFLLATNLTAVDVIRRAVFWGAKVRTIVVPTAPFLSAIVTYPFGLLS